MKVRAKRGTLPLDKIEYLIYNMSVGRQRQHRKHTPMKILVTSGEYTGRVLSIYTLSSDERYVQVNIVVLTRPRGYLDAGRDRMLGALRRLAKRTDYAEHGGAGCQCRQRRQ